MKYLPHFQLIGYIMLTCQKTINGHRKTVETTFILLVAQKDFNRDLVRRDCHVAGDAW